MDNELADKINASGKKICMAVTGGGADWAGNFLQYTGGSKTLVEFAIPYAMEALNEYIGGKPRESYTSDSTARQMAVAAFTKCKRLTPVENAVGIGMCCSIKRDDTDRKGRFNGGYIAAQTLNSLKCFKFEFGEDSPRENQIYMISIILDYVVALSVGIIDIETMKLFCTFVASAPTRSGVKISMESYPEDLKDPRELIIASFIESSYIQDVSNCFVYDGGIYNDVAMSFTTVYSGSFNPIHEGHLEIAKVTEEIVGYKPVLELSIKNFDKPDTDIKEILKRVRNIESHGLTVVITDRATYAEKSEIFFGSTFAVGADTLNRISKSDFDILNKNKVNFLPFCRDSHLMDVGAFGGILHPESIHTLAIKTPNISSTQIRQKYEI